MNLLQKLVATKYKQYGGYFFYRCRGCRALIDETDIKLGGCECGGYLSPARLSRWEEFKILLSLLWK